jgi:hypothetical protein
MDFKEHAMYPVEQLKSIVEAVKSSAGFKGCCVAELTSSDIRTSLLPRKAS